MLFLRPLCFTLLLSTLTLAQSAPVAFLSQLYPDTVAPGHAQFQLTVSGAGFRSGAVVNWNGTPLATTFTSVDRLEATVPADDVASAGTATITVSNLGSIASNVVYFPVHRKSASVAFTRYDINLSSGYGDLVVADFNGDGEPDIAVTEPNNSGTGSINVYLNSGHRRFTGPVVGSFGCVGDRLVVGDFNGDGKLDVLTANLFGDGCVLLGNGDGTFSQGPLINYFPNENNIAVGDFNRDGKLDLFVTGGSDGAYGAEVYLGNGDGSFSRGQSPGNLDNPQPPIIGDFNRDGKLDVAIGDSVSNSVWVFLGAGNGNFAAPVRYNTPNSPLAVAAVDLNGDGKLDLVTDGITVLQGNGDGTFTVGAHYQPSSGLYLNPVAGDFNNDGHPDIVLVQDAGQESLALLLGNGDDTLQTPLTWPAGTYSYPGAIGAADFNGDGLLDAVVLDSASTVSVFLQSKAN